MDLALHREAAQQPLTQRDQPCASFAARTAVMLDKPCRSGGRVARRRTGCSAASHLRNSVGSCQRPDLHERVSNDALNEAVLWRAGHLTFGRCDRHGPFRLTPAASGHERLRGVPQSVRQAFSLVLAVDEQGDDLVDAPLAGVGAIGCIDVFNLTPLHAFITRYRPGFRHHTPARPYRTSPHRTARTYGSSARPAVAASGQRGSQMTSGMSRSVQRW